MPTFLLKKYNQENDVNKENKTDDESSKKNEDENAPEELTITVTGTVSEIVANALNKAFQNKLQISEVEEEKEDTQVKAISTENINISPIDTFNSIHKDDIVFIHNRGFKTSTEEWFLTNIENKTKNVFYTIESFIKFVKIKLAVD